MAGHVQLAHGVAHAGLLAEAHLLRAELPDGLHRPLPARGQLRRPTEHLAVEREVLLHEGPGEHRSDPVDGVEGEPVLPDAERDLLHQRGEPLDGGGLPDHHGGLRLESGGGEERRPVDAGCALAELGALPGGGVPDLERLGPGGVHVRDAGFEFDDAGRLLVRRLDAGEPEHLRDVSAVRIADGGHLGVGGEVVLAIGHPEAALEEVAGVDAGLVQVRRHPQSEEPARVVVGGVQRVDVGAQVRAQRPGQRGTVAEVRDGGELGTKRLEPRDSTASSSR